MRLATTEQCKKIDELSSSEYKLSNDILMESAGALSAREIEQAFFPELKKGQVAIVCGPGRNGGDGLVLARHLHSSGHRDIVVFLAAEPSKLTGLSKQQLDRVVLQGIKVKDFFNDEGVIETIHKSALTVDAVFGVGLNRGVSGEYAKVVDTINSVKSPVISLDTPTGLDSNNGTKPGAVVNATMTITFGMAKPGFFVADGPRTVGKLRIMPIGFPYECLRSVATTHFLFSEKLARRYLPKRKDNSNKSHHGHTLVMAGSEGAWGAGVLASTAAYRVGSGYVTWGSLGKPEDQLISMPEMLTTSLENDDFLKLTKISAVAIGPGLGVNQRVAEIINLLKQTDWPVVLDADAITACVKYNLFPLPSHWVMTPHSGELSRVTGVNPVDIEKDRFQAALKGAELSGCHVLLKGFKSVLAYGHRVMVINSGNSALAKAGTGDVLTGMIAGLMAQGVEPVQATGTAAYIHGRMADEWVRSGHDRRSLTASDLKDHLPILMSRLEAGALV